MEEEEPRRISSCASPSRSALCRHPLEPAGEPGEAPAIRLARKKNRPSAPELGQVSASCAPCRKTSGRRRFDRASPRFGKRRRVFRGLPLDPLGLREDLGRPSYEELLQEISELRQRVAEQQRQIEEKQRQLEERERQVAEQERLVEELRNRIAQLEKLVEELQQRGKRQASPFSKGEPKAKPKRPGRKAGDQYGRQSTRARPDTRLTCRRSGRG